MTWPGPGCQANLRGLRLRVGITGDVRGGISMAEVAAVFQRYLGLIGGLVEDASKVGRHKSFMFV